jgi:hypothetical protein
MRNRLILQPKARGENDGPADAGANCGEAFKQIETNELSRQLCRQISRTCGRGCSKLCANVIIRSALKLRRKRSRRFVVQQRLDPAAQ